MLEVDVAKALGNFAVAARFAANGPATALFGPSGSGKTSIVNMIAGLIRPDRGRIVLDGEVLFDAAARVNVPAYRRGVGYVFQEGRLFPHLTVSQNLDYGRWMRGITADPAARARVVERFGIGHLLHRRPGRLSGGERQRVALGRALLMQPRLLLLDEPLASLDTARKAEILPFLEALREEGGVPLIYVSHDAREVKRLASQVVRIDAGEVVAQGGLDLLG